MLIDRSNLEGCALHFRYNYRIGLEEPLNLRLEVYLRGYSIEFRRHITYQIILSKYYYGKTVFSFSIHYCSESLLIKKLICLGERCWWRRRRRWWRFAVVSLFIYIFDICWCTQFQTYWCILKYCIMNILRYYIFEIWVLWNEYLFRLLYVIQLTMKF